MHGKSRKEDKKEDPDRAFGRKAGKEEAVCVQVRGVRRSAAWHTEAEAKQAQEAAEVEEEAEKAVWWLSVHQVHEKTFQRQDKICKGYRKIKRCCDGRT
jgi:hypothetical protein